MIYFPTYRLVNQNVIYYIVNNINTLLVVVPKLIKVGKWAVN